MAASRIEGIFVPNMVPFDKDGKVNEPELRRYVNWLIEQGAPWAVSQRHDRRVRPLHGRRAASGMIAVIVEEVRGPHPDHRRRRRSQRPRDAARLASTTPASACGRARSWPPITTR